MDHNLRELCMAIINEKVSEEYFGQLLVETGVRLEEPEFEMANKLLKKKDETEHVTQFTRYVRH